MPFGVNLPGVTWNSWYNPLDNVANVASGAKSAAGQTANFLNETFTAAGDDQVTNSGPNVIKQDFGGNQNESTTTAAQQQASAQKSKDLAYLTGQESLYQRLLQSLGSTLTSGLANLDQSKTAATNSANESYGRAQRDFGVKREDSAREKQSAIGQVDNNARTLSDSLRRVLGMASGSGSSAYQLAAPNAVARQASTQRSNVLNTFGKNERNLDTAVEDTRIDFENVLQGIADQRREKEEALRASILQQEQGIQSSLSDIASERAGLLGGDPLSATAPYRDRYVGIQNELDALPSRFASAITPRELKVSTPTLGDYLVDRQAINATKQSGQSQYSPYKAFLQKDEEETVAGY